MSYATVKYGFSPWLLVFLPVGTAAFTSIPFISFFYRMRAQDPSIEKLKGQKADSAYIKKQVIVTIFAIIGWTISPIVILLVRRYF